MASLTELRKAGDEVFFEYHCKESHDSEDACIWYRSHQKVVVLSGPYWDNATVEPNDNFKPTRQERMEDATVLYYRVRFPDGFEYDVFEDELLDSTDEYYRPDPPRRN